MSERPAASQPPAQLDRRVAVVGGLVLGALGILAVGLLAMVVVARPQAAAAPTTHPGFYYAAAVEAPPLELTDQDGKPFSLTSLRGHPVLVFFGYTHCPDVCPATIGSLNQVLADAGDGPRAVFVSIDPDRDGPAEMLSYLRYLPKAYTGLSGSPEAIARNAAGWGVKYAKIDEGAPDGYAMSHTADVFLVDAEGRLRAHFPFGTEPAPMTEAVRALLAEAAASGAALPSAQPAAPAREPATTGTPTSRPAPTPTPAATQAHTTSPAPDALRVLLVSSSIWAGPQTPVIATLTAADGTPLDGSIPVTARVIGANDTPTGPDVPVTAIRPEGAQRASFVATVQIPSPGWWRLDLMTADGRVGSIPIEALDPGTSAAIGKPAPDIDTPTLADVGGHAIQITTQEAPDLRFYAESTADARAAGKPYVLVVDSSRFRVSPACGRALTMTRYLLDRWEPNVAFIHLEPFRYQVVTEAPVLAGDIANPPLNDQTKALGLGDAVWPATDMPWIFVVDGQGIVRAKYRGVVGSDDIDVMLSLIEGRGVVAG